jgi:ABC-type arginine transport system permease subunit
VLFMAAKAAGSTRQPFTFYLAAALIYLLLTTVSTVLLGWAERRAERPYRRPAHGH